MTEPPRPPAAGYGAYSEVASCVRCWSAMRIPGIPRRKSRGLTEFGCAAIERMNSLGMIIDVPHSDTPAGFGDNDLPGIMGGNFMRVFEHAVPDCAHG